MVGINKNMDNENIIYFFLLNIRLRKYGIESVITNNRDSESFTRPISPYRVNCSFPTDNIHHPLDQKKKHSSSFVIILLVAILFKINNKFA